MLFMSIAFWTSILVLIATTDDMELLDGEENQYITYIAYLLRLFWRRKVILPTFTSIVVMYLGWKPYALFVLVNVCLFSMTPIA